MKLQSSFSNPARFEKLRRRDLRCLFKKEQTDNYIVDTFQLSLPPSVTRAARATIRDAVGKWSTVSYWLDLGNNSDFGQFILGEPLNERNRRAKLRLRSAAELFPEIVNPNPDNDGEPSCSAVESLERQKPFVNSTLAQHALALLARLFRYGEVSYHGGFNNLASGMTSVLRIDPQCWKRTRRVNKHTTPPSQRQEDGSSGGANEGRVARPDRRATP